MTARHQLDQIIAGDVFHDAATVLDHRARAIHKAHANQAIAAGPHLHAAWTRCVGGDHATQGRCTTATQKTAQIRHLEWQALALIG